MEKPIELYGPAELLRLERKIKIWIAVLAAVAVSALGACVVFCARTRTGNARAMELLSIAVFTAAGWFVLYGLRFIVKRERAELTHARMLQTGAREAVTGELELEAGVTRIPGSIDIRRLRITDGGASRRVSVNARKAALLENAGRRVTLYLVNGYAAAYEAHDAPPAPTAGKRRGAAVGGFLKNILSRLYVGVLWLLLSGLLWGWIFTLVTDAPPEKKVVVFADVYACEDTALAAALEEALPEGLRMVQAHPFSYAMFEDGELLAADIYIVRASDAAGWVDSFAPLDTVAFEPGGAELLFIGGAAYGVKIYDAATESGAAEGYLTYTTTAPGGVPEDYYLFFNRDSMHTGKSDTAAISVAQRLFALE